ncbi:MAG: hypothetical protein ACREIQ_12970, partial [Nitrospiria bacterium]
GKNRAVLLPDSGGSPSLQFFDKDGKRIWKAPEDDLGDDNTREGVDAGIDRTSAPRWSPNPPRLGCSESSIVQKRGI